MDSLFADSPYLEEMFLSESEENAISDDESDGEADVDEFSSSEESESDDDEDIPSVPICIENTRLKKAKFEGDLAATIRDIFLDAVSWNSEDFSEAHLLDMDFEKKMELTVQSYTPMLWQLIKQACTPTGKQLHSHGNKEKNRELVHD